LAPACGRRTTSTTLGPSRSSARTCAAPPPIHLGAACRAHQGIWPRGHQIHHAGARSGHPRWCRHESPAPRAEAVAPAWTRGRRGPPTVLCEPHELPAVGSSSGATKGREEGRGGGGVSPAHVTHAGATRGMGGRVPNIAVTYGCNLSICFLHQKVWWKCGHVTANSRPTYRQGTAKIMHYPRLFAKRPFY